MWCWNMVVVSGSGGWCSSELGHSRSDSDMGVGGGGRLGGVVVAPVAPHQFWPSGWVAVVTGSALVAVVVPVLPKRSFQLSGCRGSPTSFVWAVVSPVSSAACPLAGLSWWAWWCFVRWLCLGGGVVGRWLGILPRLA